MGTPEHGRSVRRDRNRELDDLAPARGIAWASVSGALVWILIGLALTSIISRP